MGWHLFPFVFVWLLLGRTFGDQSDHWNYFLELRMLRSAFFQAMELLGYCSVSLTYVFFLRLLENF